MGASLGARSVSHLEFVNSESITAMAEKKVAAILCPTTCYLLRLQCPPVRQLIDSNVPVVIASDYNPNAMCEFFILFYCSPIYCSLLYCSLIYSIALLSNLSFSSDISQAIPCQWQ